MARPAALAPHAAAGWTTSGPFGDDATAVAASPTFDTDHTVFLGVSYTAGSGATESATAAILRSVDGGTTWTTVWTHQTPATGSSTVARLLQIALAPTFTDDHTVFALWTEGTTGGVVRSTDSGQSFQDITAGLNSAGFGNTSTARTLSVSPQYSADQAVAVTANSGTTTTSYLSTNGGATWRAVTVAGTINTCAVTGGGFLLVLGGGKLGSYLPAGNAVCSTNQDLLYATSTDSGATWTPQGDIQAADSGANTVESQHSLLSATADGRNLLYTDEAGHAIHSSDGGATWQSVVGSELGRYTPPGSAGRAPYTFNVPSGGQGIYAVPLWGTGAPRLYHSGDGGATWSLTWAGHGSTFAHDVAAAGAHTLFYAVGNAGLLRSTDGGTTWQSVGSFQPPMSAVAVSPAYASDSSVFATDYRSGLAVQRGQDQEGYGIFRAESGGATWHEPEASEPDAGTIWTTADGGGLSLAVSPAYTSDHTVFEGDQTGTVHISHDGGATWTPSLIGGQDGWYISGLAVSPRFASDHVVFAALRNQGYGIVRSSDGGQTWMQDVPQDRRDEIADLATYDVQAVADPSGLLDLAIAIGGNVYLAQDDGHGATPPEWSAIGQGIGGSVGTIALSPAYATDCTIYAGTGIVGMPTLDDGLYVSTNACPANAQSGTVTWTHLTNGLPARDITSIALSPDFASDHTLVVSSQTRGVFVSTDAGASWSLFTTGLGTLAVNKLALTATGGTAGTLFAATEDGIWQTSVALVPHALPQPTGTDTALPTSTNTALPTSTNTPIPTKTSTNIPNPTSTTTALLPSPSGGTNASAPTASGTVTQAATKATVTATPTTTGQAPSTGATGTRATKGNPGPRHHAHGTERLPAPTLRLPGGVLRGHGTVLVSLHTRPRARVTITLTLTRRTTQRVVVLVGHGKQRKKVTRTLTTTLYRTTVTRRADTRGQVLDPVHVGYAPSRALSVTLTVTVQTPQGTTASRRGVTVWPALRSGQHTARAHPPARTKH